jgi:hypothetical protein
MRKPSSSYAGMQQNDRDVERAARDRLTADRLARQQRAKEALAISSARAIQLYRAEKERAQRQGKPTLLRVEEYRGASA